MRQLFLLICIFFSVNFYAQTPDSLAFPSIDSISPQELNEIIIIGNPAANTLKKDKALGSLDSYLEKSNSVNMVKRGAYAWEPMINGMSTERSVITIDGMRIFNACTDKMDPITSYVENTNLSSAKITDGQSGAEFGGTIAGSIDLIRKKSGFQIKPEFGGSAFAGFESNNNQQIYGTSLNYSAPKYFIDVDFTFRDADNYKAGHKSGEKKEVDFSQFRKYNTSAIAGFKLNAKQEIEASLIYDKATDVGYPGLPMDVSLAEALIASVQHRYKNPFKHFNLWETKAYFNTITHVMDDTPRPIVPIRMDMPGWSKTQGFYSKLSGRYNNHAFKATLSGYRNNSIAEMIMYPEDPDEKDMYMLTWPDVNTLYSGLSLADNISLNADLSLLIEAGIGIHHNKIRSKSGLSSLQIYYPDLSPTKTRILKNLSTRLSYFQGNFLHEIGMGYGDRAPSVSEGYGFYLLNINDNYDYIGNPNLKNEKSINFDFSSSYEIQNFSAKIKANYFYILDYIIGKPRLGIPPMNITANGIKVYEQLNHASILNTSLGMNYSPFLDWNFSADFSYRYGQGAKNTILPLIQPFTYKLSGSFEKHGFFTEISVEGSMKNRNSLEFGEIQKPAYAIANIALSKDFAIKNSQFIAKLGVQNLFDHYYSTFDDWFGIPKMGRNIYTNLIFKF